MPEWHFRWRSTIQMVILKFQTIMTRVVQTTPFFHSSIYYIKLIFKPNYSQPAILMFMTVEKLINLVLKLFEAPWFIPYCVTEIWCLLPHRGTVPDPCTESTKRLTKRNLKSSSKGLGGKRRWANARSWLEHRRAAVRKAVGGQREPCTKQRVTISRMAKKLWSKSHEKEVEFTKKKQHNRRHLNRVISMIFLIV